MRFLSKFALTLGFIGILVTGFSLAYAAPSLPGAGSPALQAAAAYPYVLWHDSTSDAVLQDALPNSGRMFILYYKSGSQACEQQQRYIEDVARNWGDYITNNVRFYKIDVDADVTTISRVQSVPTMLMVVPDFHGKLIVLNCAVGACSHEQTYDFFQKAMQNPAANASAPSQVSKVTPDQVAPLLQSRGLPVIALYYDSSSLLSAVEAIFFDQLSVLHANDMSFVKIDLIQDEDDSNRLGGIPCLVIYSQGLDGRLVESKPANGFLDISCMEEFILTAK